MFEKLKWWKTEEEQIEEEFKYPIFDYWADELEESDWKFCAIIVDPDEVAEAYDGIPFPSQQVVIEQNGLGEYRTRELMDIIDN